MGYDFVKYNKSINSFWPRISSSPRVFYEEDIEAHNRYNHSQFKTQMMESDNALRRLRHYTLRQLFNNSLYLEGDVVECGTFHGLSAYQFAEIISKNELTKTLHIFDSFEGLSKIEKEDKSKGTNIPDQELQKQFAYGLDLVKSNLSEFDCVKFYKGWILDRFKEVESKKFSFVHIDVDLYQTIKDSFEFFFPLLVNNGIMVFDDYGHTLQFPGAKKAIDEVLKSINPQFFLSLPSGQAFLIK